MSQHEPGTGDDAREPTDDTLIRLLRQLTVESDRFAELFGETHGMHRTDLNALALVMDAAQRGEPMSPGTLARALHLSPSATTAALDRLEAAGHLTRGRAASDRRRVELHMRDTALELGREFFTPLGVEFARAWADFTPDQRTAIARFLQAGIDATIAVRGRFHDSG